MLLRLVRQNAGKTQQRKNLLRLDCRDSQTVVHADASGIRCAEDGCAVRKDELFKLVADAVVYLGAVRRPKQPGNAGRIVPRRNHAFRPALVEAHRRVLRIRSAQQQHLAAQRLGSQHGKLLRSQLVRAVVRNERIQAKLLPRLVFGTQNSHIIAHGVDRSLKPRLSVDLIIIDQLRPLMDGQRQVVAVGHLYGR